MEKKMYISEDEHKKCGRVAEAFAELYENEDIVVLDAGRYGYVKLQYYRLDFGFETMITFTDSRRLFDDLWEEWLNTQLIKIAQGTALEEKDYKEMFKSLPADTQKELLEKRSNFAHMAGDDSLAD